MKAVAYPHPRIAREGWPILFISFLLAIGASFWSIWLALPLWLFGFFALQFFRDPPRSAPIGTGLVLAPADGRIVSVESLKDPYFNGRESLRISVFMNVFNVHSNRSPIDSQVQSLEYFPGSFLNADLDKASSDNERNAMVLQTKDDHVITVVQVAGLVARRILCYAQTGQHLQAGERYGFIRFGSRVDVYLPPQAIPRVALGDKVKATSTVLAILPEDSVS